MVPFLRGSFLSEYEICPFELISLCEGFVKNWINGFFQVLQVRRKHAIWQYSVLGYTEQFRRNIV